MASRVFAFVICSCLLVVVSLSFYGIASECHAILYVGIALHDTASECHVLLWVCTSSSALDQPLGEALQAFNSCPLS